MNTDQEIALRAIHLWKTFPAMRVWFGDLTTLAEFIVDRSDTEIQRIWSAFTVSSRMRH